jgi:hypothetical protein
MDTDTQEMMDQDIPVPSEEIAVEDPVAVA